MPLFPLDPPPSLYTLFWGWLRLCVKLYRGVITAPLEKGGAGGGGLREQEAGRCSCLNWSTSTESEQPENYATAPNPFPWTPPPHKKQPPLVLCISSLREKRGLFQNMPMSHITAHFILTLSVHSLCWNCPEVHLCNQLWFLFELNTTGLVWYNKKRHTLFKNTG